ncbi:ABC-three component system protein [Leptospirillum ferriphilum]|uniref:ABC-three component system protein n=1 Tax=Leptospirillum ferriphilum TaxID=178606 RepID=UPI00123763A3|nr:ABC-three component system protein [Leptospirillum ferriphilum]
MEIVDFWYRCLFKLRIYQSSGEQFQHLINELFGLVYPGFQPIAPWGSNGDGGNDGWIPTEGHYLQCYGPKAGSNWEPVNAARKAQQDFKKLLENWSDLRRYSFVLNDRFEGVPAPVQKVLQMIASDHSISSDVFSSATLTNLFMELTEDKKQMIVNGVPSGSDEIVDSRCIGELLQYLADRDLPPSNRSRRGVTSFEEKIRFNGLDGEASDRLRLASHQVGEVDEFLRSRDQWLAQGIAEHLKKTYQQCQACIPEGEDTANLHYVWLVEEMRPPHIRHPHSIKAYRQAAEIVLAKYFEACNVFKSPSGN